MSVEELFATLDSKGGNTAAMSSAVGDWFDKTEHWSMTHEQFGRVVGYFESNSATACSVAGKIAEHLGYCYCEAIAQAISHVSNSSTALAIVEKLSDACQDKGQRDVVLRQMAGPPSFCSATTMSYAYKALDGPEDEVGGAVKHCREFEAEAAAKLQQQEDAGGDADSDDGDGLTSSWAAPEGTPTAWVDFWKRKEESNGDPEKTFDASAPMFTGPEVETEFTKLGENKVPSGMQFLGKVPKLGSALKAKWQTRHARVIGGLLFYFNDSGPTARPLGCIGLAGATVSKQTDAHFELSSPQPRRPGRSGRGVYVLGIDLLPKIQPFL